LIKNAEITPLLEEYSLGSATLLGSNAGRNSSIYQIQAPGGETFTLKIYRGEEERCKRSLEHELEAHRILGTSALIPIPRLINSSFNNPSLLYEWIEGDHPTNLDLTRKFLLDSFVSLRQIFEETKSRKMAVDSVTCISDIGIQLSARHNQLSAIDGIPKNVRLLLEKSRRIVMRNLPEHLNFPVSILSFSDYGPHNLIESTSGKFFFIDFEFFGNDSITKMICDLHLHPKSIFSSSSLFDLYQRLSDDSNFEDLYEKLLPPLALKWLYIALRRKVNWSTMSYLKNSDFDDEFLQYLEYIDLVINEANSGIPMTHYEYRRVR